MLQCQFTYYMISLGGMWGSGPWWSWLHWGMEVKVDHVLCELRQWHWALKMLHKTLLVCLASLSVRPLPLPPCLIIWLIHSVKKYQIPSLWCTSFWWVTNVGLVGDHPRHGRWPSMAVVTWCYFGLSLSAKFQVSSKHPSAGWPSLGCGWPSLRL